MRTLDNGESVRLQYRSLQKLGGQLSNPEMSTHQWQPLTPMLIEPDLCILKYLMSRPMCLQRRQSPYVRRGRTASRDGFLT